MLDKIITLYGESWPRRIWEVDKNVFDEMRQIKDASGKYLWNPEPNYPDMPGTFMGIEISLAEEDCFQMLLIFPDGDRKVCKAAFEI